MVAPSASAVQARTTRRVNPVYIVGLAATPFLAEQDAMPDELVFDAVEAALRECGLKKQDIGMTIQASMDALDGRSISSGLSTAASGGYLTDSYRIEGDSGRAIVAAAESIAAGDIEVAVAVGVHNPEISGDASTRREFLQAISNLGFEPIMDRPIGLTAETMWAMHAAGRISAGVATLDAIAALAAGEISGAASRPRSQRGEATLRDVLESAPVAWPLVDLMLPAQSTGAVAVVLASAARAGRTVGRSARITGFGHATGRYVAAGGWFLDPAATTKAAAGQAYAQGGVTGADIDLVELSAPTPALHDEYLAALDLTALDTANVNASGGMLSNYPGLANGALRLMETVESLEARGGKGRAVSHSVDVETGTVSEDVTVLVVEAL